MLFRSGDGIERAVDLRDDDLVRQVRQECAAAGGGCGEVGKRAKHAETACLAYAAGATHPKSDMPLKELQNFLNEVWKRRPIPSPATRFPAMDPAVPMLSLHVSDSLIASRQHLASIEWPQTCTFGCCRLVRYGDTAHNFSESNLA